MKSALLLRKLIIGSFLITSAYAQDQWVQVTWHISADGSAEEWINGVLTAGPAISALSGVLKLPNIDDILDYSKWVR